MPADEDEDEDSNAVASRAPLNVPSKLTFEPGACGRCAGDENVFCSGVPRVPLPAVWRDAN
jgi:hypothetical protein